ncbi:hypothetical protein [Streptomyces longwoodensis]|uniref:hypothetical protein n=1 Tax=Streptomyces longwoodensis TaxID=68231 RepID=UPI00384A6DAD
MLEQQERPAVLGIKLLEVISPARAAKHAAKGPGKAQQAFKRGLAALAQWVEREGADRPVPRGHSEQITVDGEAEPVTVKLDVRLSNIRSRRCGNWACSGHDRACGCNGLGGTEGDAGTNVLGWVGRGWD